MEKRLTFIDAYAGIGGFHSAMDKMNGKCVAAIEYNDTLKGIYSQSYHVESLFKDFREFSKVRNKFNVDWFFAGFPCQPFSKAGARLGFKDPTNGDHFEHIVHFLKHNRVENVLLENVPNLLSHDKSRSIEKIISDLRKLKYNLILIREISPHDIGIPLYRPRLFLLFSKAMKNGSINILNKGKPSQSIFDFVARRTDYDVNIEMNQLFEDTFQILEGYSQNEEAISIPKPMWLDESLFDGTSYINHSIPKYSETIQGWKMNILNRNRRFFSSRGVPIGYSKFQNYPLSRRKIEYNSTDGCFEREGKIIQLRPSGIRISDKWHLPTIVRSSTQIPWVFHKGLKRFVQFSEHDLLELNGIMLKYDSDKKGVIYQALGNCVNAKVVQSIIESYYGK